MDAARRYQFFDLSAVGHVVEPEQSRLPGRRSLAKKLVVEGRPFPCAFGNLVRRHSQTLQQRAVELC
jgi:hypothetical protein